MELNPGAVSCQKEATIPFFIYRITLSHQEKEIHQVLKERQVMVCSCSSLFKKPKCENLKKIRLIFFKCNSLRSIQFMTRDAHRLFWHSGVALNTKLDPFSRFLLFQNHFWTFEIMPNPLDTTPLNSLKTLTDKILL